MSKQDADAIVVGGGLTGVASAIALAKAGLHTIHLSPTAPPDRRTSALMRPSVDYLRSAGFVDNPSDIGHPLTQIRIIDATNRLIRAPETLFDAREAGFDAFGWNFANIKLMERFAQVAESLPQLETRNLGATHLSGTIVTASDGSVLHAPLVVGADGKKSIIRALSGLPSRETPFAQSALVCDLDLGRSIGGASIEFHYPKGPFTMVPAGDKRANLVWIDDEDVLKAAQASGPEGLLAIFREKSQRLFGPISLASPSFVFPLSTLSVPKAGADGVVLVGEAAHAFPPIGAQGLNLGLRDVADLAQSLNDVTRSAADWGVKLSEDYAKRRAADLARTGTMVDALFQSLLAEMIPSQLMRSGGLWALKLTPVLRKQAFSIGMGKR
jgi:2-octaprenyl-6-methoxyphenol hydroxylase